MGSKVAAGIGVATAALVYWIGKNDLYHYGRAKEAFAWAKDNFDPVYAAKWTKKHTFEVLVHRLRRNYLKANTITHYESSFGGSWVKGSYRPSHQTISHTTVVPGSRVGIETFVGDLHPTDSRELQLAIDNAGYTMDQTKKWIHGGGFPGAGRNPYPVDPAPGWRTFWFGCKAVPVAAVGCTVGWAAYKEK